MCSPTALTAAFAEPYSVVVNSFPQPLQMFTSSVVSSSQPALSCKVQGLSEKCTLDVNVTGADEKKTKSAVEFLKEVKDDAILSRYARLTLPAGSSVDFDFDIASSKACTVTVIPVMAQETAVYGEADSVSWEEKPSLLDNVIGFFSGDTPEKEIDVKVDDDIQIDDVQGISFDLSESLNADDFASMRLMVLSDDPSVFEGKNNVIGQYGNLYLMQFDFPEAAMQAYDYYKDIVTAVEPDISVEVASNVDVGDADKEDVDTDTVNDDELDISTTEEQTSVNDSTVDETQDTNPEDNPINVLNSVDASPDVKKERGVIALIDTGVSEHANVIDRISVIDDDASGNSDSHGDVMVNAIVSQDPEAKILSIKAMDDNGYGTVSALVAAMEYAIEQKVSIINLSLYARTTLSTSVLKSEIEKATDAGIIVVGAAGNDGADVKDYVPGSVESAYIIGAAGKSGYRQVLSNYGETVDYNVVASSTSEAAALFTGFVSANGLDGVDKVLNQGLVFETGYGDGEDIVIKPSNPSGEDFSKYDVDESKSVVTRFTFADASKIEDGDTLDSIYHEKEYWDVLYGTYLARPEVYDVGDGTYKIRLDAPMINGSVTDGYQDVVFARGNDAGQVITEGVSFDKDTGIATVTKEAFEGVSEDDYADLQVQVLTVVNDAPKRVMQDVTVVDADGFQYTVTVPVGGLDVESIPLSVEGVEDKLTSDDFEVYLNGERTSYDDIEWNADEHTLYVNRSCAVLVESVKVVLKKDVDAVFRTAFNPSGLPGTSAYHNIGTMFWLKEGVDIPDGAYTTATSRLGIHGWDGNPVASLPYNIGTATFVDKGYSGLDGDPYETLSQVGIPKSLFGVNFTMYDESGNPKGDWEGYNPPIELYCNHTSDPWAGAGLANAPYQGFHYKIIEKWTEGSNTYYVMVVFMNNAAADGGGTGLNQTPGGIVKFGVPKDDEPEDKIIKLKVEKHWDENGDTSARPASVRAHLYESTKRRGTSTWVGNKGDWSDWDEIKSVRLNDDNDWKHTWTGIPRVKVHDMSGDTVNDTVYKYKIVEDAVSGYKTTYKQFVLTGAKDGDTVTAKITNELDPLRVNLKAKKVWSDSDNALKVKPSKISLTLMVSHKFPGDDGWSSWEDVSTKKLTKDNKWTVTWTNRMRKKGKKLWKYKIVEKTVPDNYKVSYDPDKGIYDFTDVEDGDTLLVTVTNKIDPSYLKLHKDSELPNVTDDNDNYSLAGAIYEVYTDSDCASAHKANYIGGPLKTNSNGDTSAIKLVPGTYWVKETNAPDGFYKDTEAHKVTVKAEHTSDKPMKLKVTDKPKQGKIKITKTSKIPNKTDNNSAYSLENAQYGVYTEESCVAAAKVTTITTDAEGKGTSSNLPLGDYWVKEIEDKPSKGFGADPTVYPVTITEKSDGTVTTPAVESKEPPVFGKIEVTKKSENPDMTDGNDCYSYEGAKYRVYTDEACTERYGTKDITIGANGKGELGDIPFGTYWVKELSDGTVDGKGKSYAKGYFVDTKTHKVVVKSVAGDSTNTTKLASEEPAMNDPLNITIQKIQKGPSNGNLASLENAEFTVKYYDGFYTKSNIGDQTPTRVWVIKTKRVGSSNRYRALLHEDYAVTGKCDEFYKNEHDNIILPLGTITVQETKPAPGYVLDGNGEFKAGGTVVMRDNETYVAQIKDSTSGVNLSGGNEYTMENSTSPIHCRIEKLDGNGNKVAGVTYKIEYQQARDVYKKTTTVGGKTVTTLCDSTDDGAVLVARNTKNVYDKSAKLVGNQTTNAEGKAAFEDLFPDDYVITEVSTVPPLQLLAEPINVSLPMRMTKAEADEWGLDTFDSTKVQWSDSENCFIVLDATFEVTNNAMFKIPMSGGTVNGWTFIPLVLGMGVFAGIAFVLFRKKKNMRAS